ncbi:MAG: acyl carrier protein [Thermodesulfobacteriota bacterium]
MEIIQIEKRLIDYFKKMADMTVDSKTLLLEEKIIDSMGVIELVAFIEATYGVELTDDDLTVDNFKDIDTIVKLISEKKGTQPL